MYVILACKDCLDEETKTTIKTIIQSRLRGWTHVLWASLQRAPLLEGEQWESFCHFVGRQSLYSSQVPVLLLFVLLLMFILVLVAGYRIRLPFFLGDISPGLL